MATQQQAPQQQTQPQSGPPIKHGAAYGALSFVLGYAVTYGYLFTGANEFMSNSNNTFEMVGWVFFNAQFVGVEVDNTAGTLDLLSQLVTRRALDFPAILLTLLIGFLLLAAGYRVADAVAGPQTTTDEGSVYGAWIASGYLPLVFLSGFVFEVQQSGASARPDIFAGVLLAGLVFPALVGALGGYLAIRRNQGQA